MAAVSPQNDEPGMSPAAFRHALKAAGIEEGKPLYPVLLTVFEAAETAHAAATGGARGLTPDGERALIERIGGEVAAAAEREVGRLARRADLLRALQLAALGLALLAAGYGAGQWSGAHAREGSVFMAQIAGLNDARALAQKCRETQRQVQGGTACDLPPVWVRR